MPQVKKETKNQTHQAKKRRINEVANNQTMQVELKTSISPKPRKQQ